MNQTLKEKCKLFMENREALDSFFKLELSTNLSSGAILYTQANKRIDIDRIKECYNILKQKEDALSDYRTVLCIPIVVKMSLSENPSEYFDSIKKISKKIKEHQKELFVLGTENVISSIILKETVKEEDIDKIIEKAVTLYKMMKKEHPILTSEDDRTDAVVLAISNKKEEKLIEEMEECYQFLVNKKIGYKGSIQALSHVLALSDKSVEEKCNKIVELHELLKQNKIKFEFNEACALAMIGALVNIDVANEAIVTDLKSIYECLETINGLKKYTITNAERFMYAVIIYLNSLEEKDYNLTLNTQAVIELAVSNSIELIMSTTTIALM